MRAPRLALALLALAPWTRAARAQLGEVQLGAVASYGAGRGSGAGLVLGVAAGRFTYAGLRWVYNFGSTEPTPGPNYTVCCVLTTEARNRVQLYAADLGVVIPAGPVDLVVGASLGALRYAQRQRTTYDTVGAGAGTSVTEITRHAVEFEVAPSLAAEIHLGGFAVIPELQYSLTGNPDLPFHVPRGGLLVMVRFVRTIEVGRITR